MSEKMTVERAAEILDPEHRENYDSLATVQEACRMGREALLKQVPRPLVPDGLYKIPSCPYCGSWEYLRNSDEGRNTVCGNCGQAILWEV